MDDEAQLVGRSAERAAIEALIAGALTGSSGALLLHGEAGIGKSALLEHAARRAGRLRLLGTEGVEPEADLPFAGLHRLLLPVLDSIDTLPEAQARALRAAFGLGEGAGDRFLVGAGVLTLLAEVAEPGGVLCLIDNAQWLDQASADALGFAARRLGAEGIVLLFAARNGFAPPGLARREIGGLPLTDAHRLLATQETSLAAAVRERIVALSNGNPLALLELPRALSPAQRTGSHPLPADLQLGEQIRTALLSRVSSLPEPTRRLLLVAAAEPGAGPGVLAEVAADLGLSLDDLEPAEKAGLITVSAGSIRFDSPLLRSAVYTDAPYLRRRAVHAGLAAAFSGTQPDRWAWHRAAIAESTDPVLADELERSADRAQHRAGYAATAAALERSAELTADLGHRGRRLVAAASAAWAAGQAGRAERLLRDAEQIAPEPVNPRIGLLRGVMETHRGRPSDAVPVLTAAAQALAAEDSELAVEALTAAMEAASIAGDFGQAPALADLANKLAGQPIPFGGLLAGITRLAQGDVATAAPLLTSFIEHVAASTDPIRISWGAVAAAYLGDGATGLRLYERAINRAREIGAVSALPYLLEQRGMLEWAAGKMDFAEADATESARLTEEMGTRPALIALATLTDVAAKRGDEAEARSRASRTTAEAEQYGAGFSIDLVEASLMELDLSLGRVEEALERALEIARPGSTHPMVTIMTTPSRVEILTRAGRWPAGPSADLDRYRQWTQSSPLSSHLALLARCDALVAAPDDAPPLYERALRLHEPSDRPFDHARTRLLFGEFLRRRRRPGEAREHLRAALAGFSRLGCALWAERARTELRAAGETSHTPEMDALARLSPQEMQIVRLVGDGMSNRQVAGQLFLSPRTVEYHLYKAYPKLGITSRSELVRLTSR
jgi:DNA-binding CsgD family transcriptional regulator